MSVEHLTGVCYYRVAGNLVNLMNVQHEISACSAAKYFDTDSFT